MVERRDPSLEKRMERFTHDLVAGLVNLEMHAPDSRHVAESVARMIAELQLLTDECAPSVVRLVVSGEHLRFGQRVLLRASLQAGRLLRVCHERSIAALAFEKDLEADEMLRFLQLLVDERECAAFTRASLPAALESRGIRHVAVELAEPPTFEAPPPELPGDAPPNAEGGAIRQYQAMANLLHDSHVAAYRGDDLEVDAAAGIVEQAISQMGQEPSGLLALAMYDGIDQFTVGHSVRVTLLALQVAHALELPRRDLLRVGTAALLHDIGKSRVPQEILFKVGALDPEERRIMATHARLGGEILLEHGNIDPAAIGAAFCHHMGPGGNGYPTPALPFEPSGLSRLVRVCDVFEALTSIRPYKTAMAPLHAYTIMHRMKDGFDQRWLRFFIRCIGLYPTGTRLILDSGEEALVVGDGPSLHQPRVRLLSGPGGGPLPADAPTEVTIDVPENGAARGIQAILGAGTRLDLPPHDLLHDPEHGTCGCAVEEATRTADPGPR